MTPYTQEVEEALKSVARHSKPHRCERANDSGCDCGHFDAEVLAAVVRSQAEDIAGLNRYVEKADAQIETDSGSIARLSNSLAAERATVAELRLTRNMAFSRAEAAQAKVAALEKEKHNGK